MKNSELELTLRDILPLMDPSDLYRIVCDYVGKNYESNINPIQLILRKEEDKIIVKRFSACIGVLLEDLTFEPINPLDISEFPNNF